MITQTVSVNQDAQVRLAWQDWSTACADWATTLRAMQCFRFVFRTVWEPEGRETWFDHLRAMQRSGVAAEEAWSSWEERLEAAYAALVHEAGAGYASGRQELWARAAALCGETRLVWEDVRREVAYAGVADEYFLPADAQWLALRIQRHYQQIVFTTERARAAGEACFVRNRAPGAS